MPTNRPRKVVNGRAVEHVGDVYDSDDDHGMYTPPTRVDPLQGASCCASQAPPSSSSNNKDQESVMSDVAPVGGNGSSSSSCCAKNEPDKTSEEKPPSTCCGGSKNNDNRHDDVESPPMPQAQYLQRVEFWIDGMTCTVCTGIIEEVIKDAFPDVHRISISLSTDTATIWWNANDENPVPVVTQRIQEAIENVGYGVEKTVVAQVNNHHAENGNNANDSNEDEPSNETPDSMEERWQLLQDRQAAKVDGRRHAFVGSLLGTLPILLLTMVLPSSWVPLLQRPVALFHHHVHTNFQAVLLWALATPVQFVAGWEFYRGAFFALAGRRAGMDVLVSLGTTASYGYAVYGVCVGDFLAAHFFETSAVLISFVLGGKWMQALAVRRTSQALSQLVQLQAKTAIKVTSKKGSRAGASFDPARDPIREERVPIQQIRTGDVVKVLEGASVPADGTIVHGEMSVDESMVTGESVPVLKTVGSSVLGGTVCVETAGSFCQVTGVGSDTALAQIVQLVHDAQTRAVPIQTFADTVSAYFVPAVCSVSVVTFLVWYALCETHVVPPSWYYPSDPLTFSILFAIACLVISCPCALGLATPTAVMVGTGVAAKLGILLKGGESLEIASKVDSVIFDKTGTLTKGRPVVSDFLRLDDQGEEAEKELWWLLGSLERSSEHPLAKAIVRYAEEQLGEDNLEDNPFEQPTDFRSVTGRGAQGRFGNTLVAVGNRAFATINNYAVTFVAQECMESLEEEGKTAVLVVVNGVITAILGIVDEIKDDAGPGIAHLREKMGVDVWMVTGDNRTTARAVGDKLSLPPSRVIAEALPATKLEQVRKLQAEGKVVAMVGDGINDSPALAQADVGLSLGTGAAIANEASDVVLVRGQVLDVCTALDLSRAIFRRIQWNFVWSLIYNCLGIPVATGLFFPILKVRLPPTVAALAMALSSVSVVLSSLWLRRYSPPDVPILSRRQRERLERRRRRHELRRRRQDDHSAGNDGDDNNNDLEEPLLSDNESHFDQSEVTETTELRDNRTRRRLNS